MLALTLQKQAAPLPATNRLLIAKEPQRRILETLGVHFDGTETLLSSLPFSVNDLTAGSESELQAVVCGAREAVDLPLSIEQSNYYANIIRRIATGDAPKRAVTELAEYLYNDREQVWENSWVRFPQARLGLFAQEILRRALQADKRDHTRGGRADLERFFCTQQGESFVRVSAKLISAYQVMALLLVVYATGLVWCWPESSRSAPDLARGLATLWQPAVLLFGQILWLLLFRHTGRSSVTGAEMSFFVQRERI